MSVEVIKMAAELRDLSELEPTTNIRNRMKFLSQTIASYCDG